MQPGDEVSWIRVAEPTPLRVRAPPAIRVSLEGRCAVTTMSAYQLINLYGERPGNRCGCCGKFCVYSITYDDPAKTVVRLCSYCDVELSLKDA